VTWKGRAIACLTPLAANGLASRYNPSLLWGGTMYHEEISINDGGPWFGGGIYIFYTSFSGVIKQCNNNSVI
jgi:hypothetical protein